MSHYPSSFPCTSWEWPDFMQTTFLKYISSPSINSAPSLSITFPMSSFTCPLTSVTLSISFSPRRSCHLWSLALSYNLSSSQDWLFGFKLSSILHSHQDWYSFLYGALPCNTICIYVWHYKKQTSYKSSRAFDMACTSIIFLCPQLWSNGKLCFIERYACSILGSSYIFANWVFHSMGASGLLTRHSSG